MDTLRLQHTTHPASVLVVDDEPLACKPLVEYLNRLGHLAHAVHDGESALTVVREAAPDAVILDIRMPGLDGLETLSRIRSGRCECAVLMLTALDELDTAVRAVRLGADDYLRKPVHLEELGLSLERALERRQLVQENRRYQKELESRVTEQTSAIRSANLSLKRTLLETVRALGGAIEAKDPYTRGHCNRVTLLSLAMGRTLGFDAERLQNLEYGAILHDIGKIGIDSAILNTREPLLPEEYEQIKQHPVIGARIIGDIELLRPAKEVVLHHHERYDGMGYPDGVDRRILPLEPQIVFVSDSFDAMTSYRPYRPGMSREHALNQLREGSGTQFNPELVELFLGERIYLKGS